MTLPPAPRPDCVRRLGCFLLAAKGGANRRGLIHIAHIGAQTAQGLDNIPAGLIKSLGPQARDQLAEIYTGIVAGDPIPADWLKGRACLVPKKGGDPFEEALQLWLKGVLAKNLPVSGDLLKEKAESFTVRMGIEDFKFTDRWLRGFKKRHRILLKKPEADDPDVGEPDGTDGGEDLMRDLRRGGVDAFARADDDIVSCTEPTEDEILRQVVQQPESSSDDDDDDRPQQPSAAEIANALRSENGKGYSGDLRSAVGMLADAWKAVTQDTLCNCFRHMGFVLDTEAADLPEESDSVTDLCPLMDDVINDLRSAGVSMPTERTFEQFGNADNELDFCAKLTDDEIVSQVMADSDDSDIENEEPMTAPPTSAELTRALMMVSLVYSDDMTLAQIKANMIACKRNAVQTKIKFSTTEAHKTLMMTARTETISTKL
ncbi:hypothetical protein HPB52_008914 [Rhipicephalus sanguineus]|uniref:HTH CENPB-type domain-containing protein n=1 Tax=Rhipicephalus sanguineus TaxID=34632 RepID=A0A9D4PZY6_RHISA|nr:hypothetical protein HPB52_008914 [Rhipicephalus sanguineus]